MVPGENQASKKENSNWSESEMGQSESADVTLHKPPVREH